MLHESLEDVLPYMVCPDRNAGNDGEDVEKKGVHDNDNTNHLKVEEEEDDDEEEEKEVKMTMDELISGALESTFWAMDRSVGNNILQIES